MKLTKQLILDFLAQHKLMSVATYGEHPWIAPVYYSFDRGLNLYFLSSPTTIHCLQIAENPYVAVSIAASHQKPSEKKKGVQLYGKATQISSTNKIKHVLRLWKDTLNIKDPQLTYENMVKKVISGRMYQIKPKKIKYFNQELFPVKDGEEPVLEVDSQGK